MRKFNHSACHKGKRVIVKTDSQTYIGKFIDRRSKHILIEVDGFTLRIPKRSMILFAIYKPQAILS
jgi:hypothetical protein